MVRVVVTTTTIPTRENSVQKMIQSLKSGTVQPDAIYVNLPDWYPRFKCGPDSNLEPKLVSMGVTVNKCKDYGVLTKLLPTLELEKDPETLLVILDDDMIYQPRFLEGLVKGYHEFKCPVGYSGLAYPETTMRMWGRIAYCLFQGHGQETEMLECAFGMLIPRKDMEGFPAIEPLTETSESGGAYGQTYANLVLNSSVTIATDQNAPATSETYYIAGVATGGNRTNAGQGSGTAGGLGLMVLY